MLVRFRRFLAGLSVAVCGVSLSLAGLVSTPALAANTFPVTDDATFKSLDKSSVLKFDPGKSRLLSNGTGVAGVEVKSVLLSNGIRYFYIVDSRPGNNIQGRIGSLKFRLPFRATDSALNNNYMELSLSNTSYGYARTLTDTGSDALTYSQVKCYPLLDVIYNGNADDSTVRLSAFNGYFAYDLPGNLLRSVRDYDVVDGGLDRRCSTLRGGYNISFSPESWLVSTVDYKFFNGDGVDISADFDHDILFADLDSGRFRPDPSSHGWPGSSTGRIQWGGVPRLNGFGMPEAVRLDRNISRVYFDKRHKERWYGVSSPLGFTDNVIYSKLHDSTTKANDYGKESNPRLEDAYINRFGAWVEVAKGKTATFTMQEYFCWTYLRFVSPIGDNSNNKRVVSPKASYNVGDVIKYTIDVSLPEKFVNAVKPYSSLEVVDNLSRGLVLEKVSLNGHAEADKFFRKDTRSFTFKPDASFIQKLFDSNVSSLRFNVNVRVDYGASSVNNCFELKIGQMRLNTLKKCTSIRATVNNPVPGIKLVKKGNGVNVSGKDAGSKGKVSGVKHGSVVRFSYIVTNTGGEPLRNVVLNDDKIGRVSCPKTSLNVKESMTCTVDKPVGSTG